MALITGPLYRMLTTAGIVLRILPPHSPRELPSHIQWDGDSESLSNRVKIIR